METLKLIGFIVYCLAGYWAVNRTIYANYVLYGDLATIFMRKVIVGMLAGPVCIPLAIIKTAAGKRAGMGRFPILPHPPSIYYNK